MTTKGQWLIYEREQKWCYSPAVVHQAVLPSVYTSLIRVITHHLHYSISIVFLWLLSSCFLRWLLSSLVLWGDIDNLLVFCPRLLEHLGALFEHSFLGQDFITEFLQILQLLLLLLYLYVLPPFSLPPQFSLSSFSHLLFHPFKMISFYHFF